MSDFEDLEKLLRLKRYERPPKGYYEDFFDRFQSRQRAEMLKQSSRGLFVERCSTWLWGLGNRKWLYAAGTAYAFVMIGIFLIPATDFLKFRSAEESADTPFTTTELKLPVTEKSPDESRLPENPPSPANPRGDVIPAGSPGVPVREP